MIKCKIFIIFGIFEKSRVFRNYDRKMQFCAKMSLHKCSIHGMPLYTNEFCDFMKMCTIGEFYKIQVYR